MYREIQFAVHQTSSPQSCTAINACIALINGNPSSVRTKFQEAIGTGSDVFVSTVALFELWYGVAKSSRREFNKKRLEAFFAGPIHALAFEDQDAEIAGGSRADLAAC